MNKEPLDKAVELPDNYSVQIYMGDLVIFSDCCASAVPDKETAIRIRDLIDEWIASN